jgi:membrane-bound metal-dependent hydrolase YbcI (DUF457 family)
MPSPIGHAIAGATIAHGLVPNRAGVMLTCMALAAAPDLDLLVPHGHRMATHSVAAVALIFIVAIGVTGKVTSIARVRRVAFACMLAYASHLLLDWMAADPNSPRGLQILWPFTDAWYISSWDLFRGTARERLFTAASIRTNVLAVGQEIAILGPIAWVVFRLRH